MFRFLRRRTAGEPEAVARVPADCGQSASALPAAIPNWYGNGIAIVGYGLLCLQTMLFIALALAWPFTYRALAHERGAIEIFTAIWYGLGGLLLFVVAVREKTALTRSIYVLGGIVMIFIAGEESNYGQFVFDFPTPDFLADINNQEHFNIHNIYVIDENAFFGAIWRDCRLMLVVTAIVALFLGKERLLGIPLPSMPLLLGIIVAESYVYFSHLIRVGDFLFEQTNILAMLMFTHAIITRQARALPACLSAIAVAIAIAYCTIFIRIGTVEWHKHFETQEYLYAFVALWYAIELTLGQSRFAIFAALPENRFRAAATISRRWAGPAVSVLIIAASFGLALFAYFGVERSESYFEKRYYQPITGLEPIARANFDIYINDFNLYYIKEDCVEQDTVAGFFLHIYPAQAADLLPNRRQYGFVNRDFSFREQGTMVGAKCAVVMWLPRYPISHIDTGQYIPGEGRLWEVELAPPPPPP